MSKAKLNEALLEKEQASSDLNAMERSFTELLKRLGKYEGVFEGFKKVGVNGNWPFRSASVLDIFQKS